MEDFDGWMSNHQVKWRKTNISSLEQGWQNNKQREWILPADLWEQTLWPGIQTSQQYPLTKYLIANQVKKHDGVHNLKSSWTHCANLYFPFGQSEHGRRLLAGFLQTYVSSRVNSVDAVELEYAGSGDLHPSELLGELGGMRGARQTSPDIGIVLNGQNGLVLMENKFVEHSFYPCAAHWGKYRSRPENPNPERCDNPLAGLSAATECHQVAWGRKYWDCLAPVANVEALSKLRCCPAARAGYQLFRQQALAEGIAQSGKYDFVVSSVAMDMRNEKLQACLKSTGVADVRRWGSLFNGKTKFKVWDHQQWVTWVEDDDTAGEWRDWLQYVKSRYGYV